MYYKIYRQLATKDLKKRFDFVFAFFPFDFSILPLFLFVTPFRLLVSDCKQIGHGAPLR